MIIKAYEHQKNKKLKNKIFLFYGENEGYKNQIIKDVFIEEFEGNIERFDEAEILNNFENFISSLRNKSFFDDLKLILISRVSEKIIKLIHEFLDRNINDITVVLNADTLDKKSKLRSLFEKDKTLICIPFYKDDNSLLNGLYCALIIERANWFAILSGSGKSDMQIFSNNCLHSKPLHPSYRT